MSRISFSKYNLIIAGVFFILALITGWTFWNHDQMLKKLPIALPIGLLSLLFLTFFSRADNKNSLWSWALKGWRTSAIGILVPLVLICFSICLSEKYDKDLSVGFFIFVMFAVQYVSIAFIGKKYNVDKYDSVEEFIDDNPGVEKWINKTALERMKGKE